MKLDKHNFSSIYFVIKKEGKIQFAGKIPLAKKNQKKKTVLYKYIYKYYFCFYLVELKLNNCKKKKSIW